MHVVDGLRFGQFEYELFSDVKNPRYERNLPDAAIEITMHKHNNGYRARYAITESELNHYLDLLWGLHRRPRPPVDPHRGARDKKRNTQLQLFGDLGWELEGDTVIYSSPSEPDGGGATYYFDAENDIVLQHTNFW